jgi:hypothetical protein
MMAAMAKGAISSIEKMLFRRIPLRQATFATEALARAI